MAKDHAIILGGGCAGMLAARVLADHYTRVSIVDVGIRTKRIPQGVHLHVLLKRGQQIFNDLFPGILHDAKDHCPHLDWARDTEWLGPFGTYARYASDVSGYFMSRGFLDELMQARIAQISNIVTLPGRGRVLFDEHHRRAIGAEIVDNGITSTIEGDLIVDARGRTSDIGVLLQQIGITITSQKIDSSIAYATRIFSARKPFVDAAQRYVQIRPSVRDRGIVVSPIEGSRMTVTLITNGLMPPSTEHAFMKAITEFKPYLSGVILDEPHTSVHVFRNFSSRRYVFKSASSWPQAFIALGDAACIINPVYGQGMTIAAMQAELLQKIIDSNAWEPYFQRALDQTTIFPWLLARAEEARSDDGLIFRFLRAYRDRIMKRAEHNRVVHYAFMRTLHLLDKPYALMKPNVALRAFFG